MADEDPTEVEAEEGSSKKKLIIFGGAGVAVLLIAGLAAFFLLGGDDSDDAAPEAAPVAAAPTGPGVQVVDPAGGPAIYVPMSPPIRLSFFRADRVRNLQIRMTFVTRVDETAAAIRAHMPRISSKVAGELGKMSILQVLDPQVRLDMRPQLVELVNNMLEELDLPDEIEAVLFEQVVIQ